MRWIAFCLILSCFAFASSDFPSVCMEKAELIPDYCQTDPEGHFVNDGASFCGPASVSNSLMYLAQHGFQDLSPPADSLKESQTEMIRLLATKEYMDTHDSGTSPIKMIRGIKKYINEKGYKIVHLEWEGWRGNSKEFPKKAAAPTLDWMKEAFAKPNGAVWINLGWYKENKNPKVYERTGGHWVTLVGYGQTSDGKEDPFTVAIHDPSPRMGKEPKTQYIQLTKITDGTLEREDKSENETKKIRHSATGFYLMGGGMTLRKGADCAIMDDAIALVLDDSKTQSTDKKNNPRKEP